MFNYGCGLSAFLTKLTLHPDTRWKILRQAARGFAHMVGVWAKASRRDATTERSRWRDWAIVFHEVRGLLSGPVLYFRGRRRGRELER